MMDMLLNKDQTNTALAFDAEAEKYDRSFSQSTIGVLQRNRVQHFIGKYVFSTRKNITLELNCGTGEDAVWLAANSNKVLCSDISRSMVAITKNKNASLSNVEAIQLSFTDLKTGLGEKKFDLVFSNFGGLNCAGENELKELARQLALITENNATLALVVMSTNCWWENFYFGLKGRSSRRQIRSMATLNAIEFPVWYYSPKQLEVIFKPYFEKLYQKPVGLFIPPSYLNRFFAKKKILLKVLSVLENLFGSLNFLANNADHYLIILKKKNL